MMIRPVRLERERQRGRRPPRVLFVITDLDVGGAEKCCAQLAVGLDRDRWEPAVRSLAPPGALAESLVRGDVPVYSLHARRAWDAPATVLQLAQIARRFRPAIMHTFLFHANIVGRLAARLAGIPYVLSGIRVAEK